MFEGIARDSTSSASVLTTLAARELAEMADARSAANPGEFWERLHEACRELVAAKREMASIINLVSRVLSAAEKTVLSGASADTIRRAVFMECNRVWEQAEERIEELGLRGESLVPEGATVATISTSESVRAVLAAAVKKGTSLRVLVSESRPSAEGVEFATSLPAWGIPVTVVVDAALPQLAARCELVLVGADAVSENSFTNKVGTYPLVLAARDAGVPVYVAALEDKFIPEGTRGRPDRVWDPDEVLPNAPAGVTVENRYFEEVPLSLTDGVITEGGILSPEEVMSRVSGRPVAPALLEILFPRALEATQ